MEQSAVSGFPAWDRSLVTLAHCKFGGASIRAQLDVSMGHRLTNKWRSASSTKRFGQAQRPLFLNGHHPFPPLLLSLTCLEPLSRS